MLARLKSLLTLFWFGSFCVIATGGAISGVTWSRGWSGTIRTCATRRVGGTFSIGVTTMPSTMCMATETASTRDQWRVSTRSGVTN
jgi:hypothetical protein